MKKLRYECSSDYGKFREQIIDLHKRGYGTVSAESYDSLYMHNPSGEPLLGLCFDGEKLVGQENYIRQDVACGEEIWKGGLGVNTLVDPKYRLFYGVFGNLCRLTIEALEGDLDLVCAYANEDSKGYYLDHFDWSIASKVGVFKKAIRVSGMNVESGLALLRRGRRDREIVVKEVTEFDPRFLDPVLERYQRESKHLYFYKTSEFLNWRYLRNRHYDTVGYYITRDEDVCGYCITYDHGVESKIVDFIVQGNDIKVFTKVMGWLSLLSRMRGRGRLVMYATPGSWYAPALKRLLFVPRWEFDFIARGLRRRDIAKGDWVIQIGDFDVF